MAHGVLTEFLQRLRWSLRSHSAGEATDADLLGRFIESREEAAFATLVHRHGPMVFNVCRRLVPNSADADDAFQATFLVLVRRASSIRKPQLLGNWLYGVAHRVAVRARAQAARRRAGKMSEVEMIPANPYREGSEWSPVLHEELNRLPDKYRAPMVLCYLQGKTNQEAAELLAWPVGTVKGRLTRARELLRKRLTRRGVMLSSAVVAAALAPASGSAAVPAALADATVRAALLVATGPMAAAGVSVSVAALTKGVVQTMLISKVSTVCGMVVVMGLLGSSAAIMVHRSFAAAPESPGTLAQAEPAPLPREPAQAEDQEEPRDEQTDDAIRQQSMNNLKLLALAMHNYLSEYGEFPPAAIFSKDGKALLSWRVLLLPYLDQKDLFLQFKLDEPWDGPTNKKLLEKMPAVFSPTPGKGKETHDTVYQVFTGKGTIFPSPKASKISDITDGTSNTILMIEAANAVPWTKPADLTFDPKAPLPKLGGVVKQGFSTAYADGSAHFLKHSIKEETLKKLITSNGGEVVGPDEID
jgi:RNA polymerase sigma factor (sigma-70 family)